MDRLLGPYHAVRRIIAGAEAPWPGLIVRMDSGDTAVMIDATDLPSGWAGWSADPDGHLLAALDVVRTSDGQGVLTAMCTTRLDDFLTRRTARRVLLTDGEMVTLVVSITRGLREAQTIGAGHGQWWLTDAGRPVLATDAAEASIAASTDDVLRRLLAASDSPPTWSWLDGWPTTERELLQIEARAFEITVARSLADAPSSIVTPWPLDDREHRAAATGAVLEESAPTILERMGRHLDADVADLFSTSLMGVWRRLRRPHAASRRRVAALGLAVGLAVLSVGLLWPDDGMGSPASTRRETDDPSIATSPVREPSGSSALPRETGDSDSSQQPTDIAATVSELLTRRSACDGDTVCLSEVMVRPASEFAHGVIDAASVDRRATLVDDYGGVAVVRIDPVADTGEQPLLVVVQHADERWLLRDVYVTQQP